MPEIQHPQFENSQSANKKPKTGPVRRIVNAGAFAAASFLAAGQETNMAAAQELRSPSCPGRKQPRPPWVCYL